MEKQFSRYFEKAETTRGNTGTVLLELLERRLDNIVYKLNFAPSRKSARQLVAHGHIHVNGRKVDIPDVRLEIGDKITLKNSDKTRKLVKDQLASNTNFTVQGWLQLDSDKPAATLVGLPTREDVQLVIEEQLVVEFCSR
jgi:small subunit ribosomal protein S4